MKIVSLSDFDIYMLFAGREVRIGKNCASGLEYGPRRFYVLCWKRCESWKISSGPYAGSGWENPDRLSTRN